VTVTSRTLIRKLQKLAYVCFEDEPGRRIVGEMIMGMRLA
jgi:hypothetical protein